MKKGKVVVINGRDGAGKGEQIKKLKEKYSSAIFYREPGGTEVAEKVRLVLLSLEMDIQQRIQIIKDLIMNYSIHPVTKKYLEKALKEMKENGLTGEAEKELYAASRAENNFTFVLPKINEGNLLIGERSVACSMAYQGYARGIGMDNVWKSNQNAIEGVLPDIEIYLNVDDEIAQKRLHGRIEKQDRLDQESDDFHQKTHEGYMKFYQEYCPYPHRIVSANGTIEETFEKIQEILNQFI